MVYTSFSEIKQEGKYMVLISCETGKKIVKRKLWKAKEEEK